MTADALAGLWPGWWGTALEICPSAGSVEGVWDVGRVVQGQRLNARGKVEVELGGCIRPGIGRLSRHGDGERDDLHRTTINTRDFDIAYSSVFLSFFSSSSSVVCL